MACIGIAEEKALAQWHAFVKAVEHGRGEGIASTDHAVDFFTRHVEGWAEFDLCLGCGDRALRKMDDRRIANAVIDQLAESLLCSLGIQ